MWNHPSCTSSAVEQVFAFPARVIGIVGERGSVAAHIGNASKKEAILGFEDSVLSSSVACAQPACPL